ncbi:MAG: FkbM family methyltransferase [Saprospiraceae bacterium]
MSNTEWLKALDKLEKLANGSKLNRFLYNPIKYTFGILYSKIWYKLTKQEFNVTTKTFFDTTLHIKLPASLDIFLTRGKSHSSEIRLARYILLNLKTSHHFIDIGAHYGYFSALAVALVSNSGKVLSIEASPKTYEVLKKNCSSQANQVCIHTLVSDSVAKRIFYEFPNLYSEYNSFSIEQYKDSDWFQNYPPNEVELNTNTVSTLIEEHELIPNMIKIDVEGGEFEVVKGMQNLHSKYDLTIMMEYISQERHNHPHKKAVETLKSFGYQTYIIKNDGSLIIINDLDQHFLQNKIDSDNIVLKKLRN